MKRTLKFAVCVLACLLCLGLLLKADMPQVSTGTWAPAGSMTQARTGASAALLQDGRILITGGQSADGPSASAELVNHDGSFSAAARMHIARSNHISVVLHDGRVLVAGGTTTGGRTTSSAEIYDPVSNVWSAASSMVEPRSGQTASLLEDGRVLVAGGETVGLLGPGVSASLEIFDPATNVFVTAGILSTARKGHAAALLDDGRVLIAGGSDGAGTLDSVDIYDPATELVSQGPNLLSPRIGLSATTLLDGSVLIAGGSNGTGDLASAERYDVAAGAFSPVTSELATPRREHLAFLLPHNNNVLIVGGTSAGAAQASSELFVPWAGSFSATEAMSEARAGAAGSALILDGLILIAGGSGLASAELYGFATVKTDKIDYSPGETVTITGSGWQPGETVSLLLQEVPKTHDERTLRATADALGEILNNEFQPEAHDVGVTFYLTASAAGSQAQTKFTDDPPSCTIDSDCNDGNACTADTCKPNSKCDHGKITDQCCNNGNPRSSGTACGGTPGACENQDTCDGSGICVDNGFKSSTTVCRPSAGACDPAETCTGSSAACPADAKSTAVCRASAGPCDVAESCDGVNNGCPADTFASATTVCRGSASDCDVAENCTGTSAACPADGFKSAGTACGSPADTECTNPDTCNGSGTCLANDEPAGTLCGDAGTACVNQDTCNGTGSCTDNGFKSAGTPCNDGNACTQTDTCLAGVCAGGNPVICTAVDQCHVAGICDPASGTCSNLNAPNNTPCNADNSACTQNDSCQNGVCTAGSAVVCTASDQCHVVGTCNPSTGVCSNPAKADGTGCNADSNACTQNDTCQAGLCTAGAPVVCTALDQCHTGICNPTTGTCTNLDAPNGIPCDDGNECTTGDTCQAGACTGGQTLECKVTGGGQISVVNPAGTASFGFNVQTDVKTGSVKGQLEYNNHATKTTYHSVNLDSLSITSISSCTASPTTSGKRATFKGTIKKKNDGTTHNFKVTAEDCGEPGRNDYFLIEIANPGGETQSGPLIGGNIQVHGSPQSGTMVTGAGGGIFPPGASLNGVSLEGLKFGKGLTVASAGSAQGQFQTTLIGVSVLGLKRYIQVEGKANSGFSGAPNTAIFSGKCMVDLGDGTPPLPDVPFTVVVATNSEGTGSLTLTLGATNLPAAMVNEGHMTIK